MYLADNLDVYPLHVYDDFQLVIRRSLNEFEAKEPFIIKYQQKILKHINSEKCIEMFIFIFKIKLIFFQN